VIGLAAAGSNEAGLAFLEENGKKDGVITLASGMQYKVLRRGDGDSHPTADASCSCHYSGKLIDGTTFDSSYDRGSPTSFAPNQVIKGWTEAMQLMVEGDQWEIYIPSELGYGDSGSPPKIKGGDVLVFVMEIITINGDKVPANRCDATTVWAPTLAALQASWKVDEHGMLRKGAFAGDKTLIKVVLPGGVTSIENSGYNQGAFQGCSSLREIVLPGTLAAIGDRAFAECSSLREIALPDTLAAIGDGAFDGCSSLQKIALPNTLAAIGVFAFRGCSSSVQAAAAAKATKLKGWGIGGLAVAAAAIALAVFLATAAQSTCIFGLRPHWRTRELVEHRCDWHGCKQTLPRQPSITRVCRGGSKVQHNAGSINCGQHPPD
jgi:FKBP-type peptidyl-prolyl cis-trans isomerase FklB